MNDPIRPETREAVQAVTAWVDAHLEGMTAVEFLLEQGVTPQAIGELEEVAARSGLSLQEAARRAVQVYVLAFVETKDGHRTLEMVSPERDSTVEILLHAA